MRDKQLAAVLHEREEEVQGPSRRKEIQELLWACQSDNVAKDTLQWREKRGEGRRRERKGRERGRVETSVIVRTKVKKV